MSKSAYSTRRLVAMLFANCQLAAWANNAYEYLTTLLSWTRTGDSHLTCPALQRECVLWPGENQRCTECTTRKSKRGGKSRSFSHVAEMQEWTHFPAAIWLHSSWKLLWSWCPLLIYMGTAESTGAATQALTSHIFSVQYNPVSWALCHVWMDYTLSELSLRW